MYHNKVLCVCFLGDHRPVGEISRFSGTVNERPLDLNELNVSFVFPIQENPLKFALCNHLLHCF